MEKIFVLAFSDLVNYGFGTTNVWVFNNKADAVAKMKTMYEDKCKKENIDEYDCEFDSGSDTYDGAYAYITDRYYWDIFEKSLV